MQRAREDKALEVWCGAGRTLVGWLTTFKNVPMSMSDILVGFARRDDSGDLLEETRGFPLTAVNRQFETDDLIWKELKTGDKVPLYAVRTPIDAGKTTQFTWRVLRIAQDEYEWLFDHPDFVPADTVKDRDYLATDDGLADYFTERLHSDMEDAFLYGSVPAYGTAARSASTNATSATGTESCMTLEKLAKSIQLARSIAGRR